METEIRKIARDGKVGVLVSEFDQWFTKCSLPVEGMLFLPEVIEYLENTPREDRDLESAIKVLKQCPEFLEVLDAEDYSPWWQYEEYGKIMLNSLQIQWIEEGTKIVIQPYHLGGEEILIYEEISFIEV